MASETDIANAALTKIGASTITSFTDGSKNANRIAIQYPFVRDDLLRRHNWNFATKQLKLARSSTTPVSAYDYAYPLPADWLRTISVSDSDSGSAGLPFREEIVDNQRCILANSDQVYLRYIADASDPNVMPADFQWALIVALARSVAVSIANSNTMEDQLRSEADTALMRAKSSDGMGATPESRPRGSWATSRHGSSRGAWPR